MADALARATTQAVGVEDRSILDRIVDGNNHGVAVVAQEMERNPHRWLEVLRHSQDRLAVLTGHLTGDQIRQPSYCDDWTVAQVLSHLGSGAEIFLMIVQAAQSGSEPPERADFSVVWDRWNAKTPDEQQRDFVVADAALLDALVSIGDGLDRISIRAMGRDMDMTEFLGMRLGEHALHAWDVAVSFDPGEEVDAKAVSLLIDRLPALGGALGRPAPDGGGDPLQLTVVTSNPVRSYEFDLGAPVSIADIGAAPDRTDLHLPAEALLRLVYGRLDAEHQPPYLTMLDPGSTGSSLQSLRAAFPGF
ncbi:MAG: maleylpyruvate isomerase N-terminal domain-containing protein [Acidimicrobiales bacterium]